MKTPVYEEINIPKEVIRFANNVPEEPSMYFGMELKYKYIIWTEKKIGLLVLRCYETDKIKNLVFEEEQIAGTEEWAMYIDVDNECWKVHKDIGTWGTSTLDFLLNNYGKKRSKILNPEIVREFPPFNKDNVYDAIDEWQKRIRRRQLKKRQERKDKRTNELMAQAKPLPAKYLKWHEETIMKDSRYLIYKRTNKREFEAFCTHCEGHVWVKARRCRQNKYTQCPSCGSRVKMKSSGRIQRLSDDIWTEYVQAIKNGIMIRFIEIEKDYSTYGSVKKVMREPVRIIIQKGKKAVWYEKRDANNTVFRSEAEYQRNNTEGCVVFDNFPRKDNFGGVYKRNLRRELAKGFPYHMFWEYQKRSGKGISEFGIYDYFDAFSIFPLIESLEKTGKTSIVDYMCEGNRSHFKEFDAKAKCVSELIGVTRQQYRELKDPSMDEVRNLKILKEQEIVLSGAQFICLERYFDCYSFKDNLKTVLQYMTIRQFLKYAEKKEKYEVKLYYYDYIKMGERLGYDFRNKFVLFPKNIKAAHDAQIDLIREENLKKKMLEEKEHDKGIMKVEKKIRKKFSYKYGNFFIRPAKNAREIVQEGQIQHICVGNGSYTRKMEKGNSYILFLRKVSDPDTPFYTVEITPEHEIIQRHGKFNEEGPELKEVDAFLSKFVEVKGHGKKYHAAG